MPFEFKLPDVGEGIVEGEIVRWLVKEGEHVEEDQPIVEVMTDKATVEIPSPLKGKIAKRIGDEGEVIKVGATMVVIEEEEEEEEEGQSGVKLEPAKPRVDKPKTKLQEPRQTEAPVPAGGPVLATPAVRRLAREMGVELSQVQGSGPRGRVTREDLERFKSAPAEIRPERVEPRPPSGEVETIPYRGVRKKIGERLVASKRTAPHFTYVEEVDVTELVRVRKQFQESDKGQNVRLTYLPFLMKAVVRGLKEYPLLNSTLDEEEGVIRLKKYYNIGIATDTPEGLIVPVVRDVDKKDILQLAQEVTGLSEAARAGKAKLEDLKDGTFTITSLGALGGVLATPIINYPEVAILGIHKIAQKPVVRDGQIVVRDMMNL
ncbi:2-oxo acid dehydrogenase subunit E2, partial [Acidobacteria bacterium AH-259-A15]|nr:2-oxo acid dehydrogenase subunit E2 [Acidobacteria bacterium AH-259-A15]